MTIPMWVKRMIRPLIPNRLMARFRLHQHSRQIRTNVDLVVNVPKEAKRWLAATPDTYRVRSADSFGRPPEHLSVLVPGGPLEPAPPPQQALLLCGRRLEHHEERNVVRPLSDGAIGAVVYGELAPPGLAGRRRAEPQVAPVAIALRAGTLGEVHGLPPGANPLPGLRDRLRDAGHRLAVVPGPAEQRSVYREDPIEGPVAVVLSAVPMHDVGGGSRGTQIALELLRGGFHVTYVALFGTVESTDLGLRFIHPRLEQLKAAEFDTDRLLARVAPSVGFALIEVPAAPFLEPVERLRGGGFRTVYDLIDDWSDSSLGGEWYRAEVEQRFIAGADGLTASAPDLAERLAASERPVTLVPNGVDPTLFTDRVAPQPGDFPAGEGPVIGYHGSLYGDWVDWEGLAAVAEGFPAARVVIIGDDSRSRPEMPVNVSFLGLKPQRALPDYLAHFDVGLVPFRVSNVTHAVSPLKVYEYLAMGVPVAAPPLRALEGLEGVHSAQSLTAAAAAALDAPRPNAAAARAAHSWAARLHDLCGVVGIELRPGTGLDVAVVTRPPTHYAKDERRL